MRFPARALAHAALGLVLLGLPTGCLRNQFDPELATVSYPATLHTTETVDIQVFRRDENLELVNATAVTYSDFRVWINQRYATAIPQLVAGGRVRVSLWDFRDDRGELFRAGGLLRTVEPTPVRLVEIEHEGQMVGLVTIRAEDTEQERRRF